LVAPLPVAHARALGDMVASTTTTTTSTTSASTSTSASAPTPTKAQASEDPVNKVLFQGAENGAGGTGAGAEGDVDADAESELLSATAAAQLFIVDVTTLNLPGPIVDTCFLDGYSR
jgi:hypothetical protein